MSFEPTLEAPNRVLPGRFSLRFEEGDLFSLLDCRHDLVLIHNQTGCKFLVWDPITGEQRGVPVPAKLTRGIFLHCPVVCAASDQGHVHDSCHSRPLKVVLMPA